MRTAASDGGGRRGGWMTLPFLAGGVVGLGVAMSATNSNLIVYLIKKYNVKSIDAAQVANVVRGCMHVAPVVGAVVSDAYFGCYPVVAAATAVSLLAFVLFALTATFRWLHPPPSVAPSTAQTAVLYAALCLLAVGNGGTRYNTAAMGADQFDDRRHQDAFFSWYFVFLYASYILGDTVVVYVQDSVSWALGFGVCIATTALGLAALVAGSRYFRRPVHKGSPFTALARVVVAAVRKPTVLGSVQYYHEGASEPPVAPSESFNGSVAKPWRLCTVRQVEDMKCVVRVLPLWTSGVLVSMTVNVQISLAVLQALTMDRAVGRRFAVPAGSMTVATLAAFVLFSPLFDRAVAPLWERLAGGKPTALQRVGLGHAANVASMAAATLVERRRIHLARSGQSGHVVPMSAMWLVLQLGLTGVEEALHLPGNTALFYQEFPKTLRSTATAMAPLFIAVGSYLSTAFVDAVRRATRWLPNDLNQSRLDCVYWTLTLVAAANFGYFLVCASMYTYNDVDGNAKAQMDEK